MTIRDLYHRIYTAIFSNTLNVSRIIAALRRSRITNSCALLFLPEMKTQAVSRCVIAGSLAWEARRATKKQTEREGEGKGADSERTRKTNSSENTLVYTQHRRDVFRGLFRARKRISFCERSFLSLPRLFLSRETSLSLFLEEGPPRLCARSFAQTAWNRLLPVYQAMQNSRGVIRVDYTRLIIAACDTACNAATFRRRAETRGPIITIGARSESREQEKGSIFFRAFHFPHFSPPRYAQPRQQPQRSSQAAAIPYDAATRDVRVPRVRVVRERYGIT